MNVLGLLEIPNFIVNACLVLILFYVYMKWKYSYWSKQGVNGPTPWPLIGNFSLMFPYQYFHISVHEEYKKFGRTYGLYEPSGKMLVVAEPEDLKNILVKDFDKFCERRFLHTKDPVMGNMLTAVRGAKWKAIRNAMTPAFSGAKMKLMSELIIECSDELANNLREYAEQNREFDAKRIFGSYTMDVIANTAFGTGINSQKNPDNQFVQNAQRVFNPKMAWKSVFLFLIPKFGLRFGLSTIEPDVMEFFSSLVRKIITMRKKENVIRNDFLSSMIDSMKEGTLESDSPIRQQTDDKDLKIESKKFMDEDTILAQCILFFLGGYDTTATTLTMTAYNLAMNPDCQEKLIKEVDRALETHGDITYDAVQEMPYLKAVINETLRLYTPAVRGEREVQENYKLRGINLEKGTIIGFPIYAIHRDPEFWPDPERFDPERFIGDHSDRDTFTYIPFGMGQKSCLAKRFGLMEVRIAIATVLKTMKFVRTPKLCEPPTFTCGAGFLQPEDIFIGIELR